MMQQMMCSHYIRLIVNMNTNVHFICNNSEINSLKVQ